MHEHSETPAAFLVDHISRLPRGRALDIATGAGRNALYLAQHGFTVDGVDRDQEALAAAHQAAQKAGVSLNLQLADLEQDYPIPHEAYDLIICFNYLERSLLPRISAGLRPGGMLMYETFILEQAQFGKPTNPHFLLRHNELLHAFLDLRCLCYQEGIRDRRQALASLLAQKVLPETLR